MSQGEVIMESAATFTDKDAELYERATAAGIPSLIVSMYRTALQKLIADEREECAKLCDERIDVEYVGPDWYKHAQYCADAIRARGKQK